MHDAERSAEEGDAPPPVADISQQALDVVFASDDSALANAVRRIVRGMGLPGESYAAHGSTP
jgi:FXSXX-COOH protein